MKKLIIAVLTLLMITGCATTKVATTIGVGIGESFQEAALQGTVSAEQSIEAWPYISGLIQGILADNYSYEVPPIIINIIDKLDTLAAQPSLSEVDKGIVIGSFVRLEALALAHSWDRYGVNILQIVTGPM